jgi:hypothetical protein
VRIKRAEEFGDQKRGSYDQSGFQAAPGTPATVVVMLVSVSGVGHITAIIIGELGCYNKRFSRARALRYLE